jgi:probable rRNA maturation factor
VTVLDVEVVKAVMAPVQPAFLRRVLQRAATVPELAARLPDGESTVALRITGDEEMEVLNRTYADLAHATDVLSFIGVLPHVGDIAISWPAVERQARTYRHEARTELALLAVHGFIHLLGWDHAAARERHEMNRLTVDALARSRIILGAKRL